MRLLNSIFQGVQKKLEKKKKETLHFTVCYVHLLIPYLAILGAQRYLQYKQFFCFLARALFVFIICVCSSFVHV